MRILWRSVVLLLAGWFLAALILGHKLPRDIPTTWITASLIAAFALGWLWWALSLKWKNRAQP